MRPPLRPRDDDRTFDVNMTPMIDVVFLLLVFFVCTTDFQAIEALLPTPLKAAGATGEIVAEPPELDELENVVIKLRLVDGAPRWEVNARVCREPAELHETLARLAAIERRLPVVLDIDGAVPLGDAIDLYDRCRLAGFDRVRLCGSGTADSVVGSTASPLNWQHRRWVPRIGPAAAFMVRWSSPSARTST